MKGFVEDLAPAVKQVSSAVAPAAQFIKKNWQSPQGSLLLETRSKMFPAVKRRRGRSRSMGRKRQKRSNSRAMVVYQGARANVPRRVAGIRRFRRYKKKRMGIGKIATSLRIAGSMLFTLRRQGSAHMQILPNVRVNFVGRLYNHSYEEPMGATPLMDFGTQPSDAVGFVRGKEGFLNYYTISSATATAQVDNDQFQSIYARFNQFNVLKDLDRTVFMRPLKAHFQWKNNSTKNVTMHFYVLKAKTHIPWDSTSPVLAKSLYSPEALWGNYMTRGTNLPSGNSNFDGSDILAAPWVWFSDARSGFKNWYSKVMYRKLDLQPGDESDVNIVQPGKRFTLRQLQLQHQMASKTHGAWAMKGDYIVMTLLVGGISHEGVGEPISSVHVGFGGVELPEGVDLIVTKTFSGRVVDPVVLRHFHYLNDKPLLIGNGEQVLPSYST